MEASLAGAIPVRSTRYLNHTHFQISWGDAKQEEVYRMRTIRESAGFTAACAELGVERMDEVLTGVFWGLSKNPRHALYPAVPDTDLRFAAVDATPGIPEMRIYLSISADDEYVDVLVIERVDDDDPDDPSL